MLRPTCSLILATALAACSGSTTRATGPQELQVLKLSDQPTVEIGVMDGDTRYIFQDVTSVIRLADGNLAVSDGGGSTISVFDPHGSFVRSFGGNGEGPGEFRSLSRIYRVGTDSIFGLDAWTERLSFFDTAGTFSHQVATADIATDSVFKLDVWLHGRFWVDGALGDQARARVNAALDRLPAPRATPGYRFVRVAGDGRLWIREPEVDADGQRAWTITNPQGQPEATIQVPVRFEPQSIAADEVLGRWYGESDVNFVRAYAIERGTGTRPAPGWIASPAPIAEGEAMDEKTFRGAIVGGLKQMASAQEIYYSEHYSYTSQIDSLSAWDPGEDLMIDFVSAGTRGWEAVFAHPTMDRICALAYGANIPAGWTPGMVTCSPAPTTSTDGEG